MPIPLFPPIFTAAPAEVAAEPDAAGVRSPPSDHSSGSGATSQQYWWCHLVVPPSVAPAATARKPARPRGTVRDRHETI